MFVLVSLVLTDFLTIALISRCDYLAVWIKGFVNIMNILRVSP